MTARTIRFLDSEYPVIAWLGETTALAAHPNGPCICDGYSISTLDIHYDDYGSMKRLKVKAQDAFNKWAWPILYPIAQANLMLELIGNKDGIPV